MQRRSNAVDVSSRAASLGLMTSPLEWIGSVGTPIALVAFVIGVAAYAYRLQLDHRRGLVESASDKERGELVRSLLEGFPHIATEDLSEPTRRALVERIIRERAAKFRLIANVSVIFAVILALVIIVVTLVFDPEPTELARLVVRVDGPESEIVSDGSVTLTVGQRRNTDALNARGEVAFEDVSMRLPERGMTIRAEADGFRAQEQGVHEFPADGIINLRLEPEVYRTQIYGLVFSSITRQPLAQVELFLDDARVAVVSSEDGSFRTTIGKRAGATVVVRAVRDGHVGYNGRQTVQQDGPWSIFFDDGESP